MRQIIRLPKNDTAQNRSPSSHLEPRKLRPQTACRGENGHRRRCRYKNMSKLHASIVVRKSNIELVYCIIYRLTTLGSLSLLSFLSLHHGADGGWYLLINPVLLNSLALKPTHLKQSRAKLGQDHETLATAGVRSIVKLCIHH
jgi:hypothetical protein